MRWRALALVSLGINVVLVAAWWRSARHRSSAAPTNQSALGSITNSSRTNFVVRRQIFSWRELESTDYPTYVANLREIGCPEQTIRDVIIADINALYARRRASELLTSEQQWWRSEPDPEVLEAAAEKSKALEDERRGLLTRLLGANWEAGDIVSLPRPSQPGVVLDGPVLGSLPSETKQAIQMVNLQSQEKLQDYLEAQRAAGKNPDPVELAKLRQQTRDDLKRILPPSQLEEYLLRYSQNANDWRAQFGQLKFFDPTPDEFRAVFRATDVLDQQIQLLADATDANSLSQRKILEDQRENALKTALGAERYEDYRLLQQPAYRDAVTLAEDAGAPEAAKTIFQINQATATELDRVRADTNLTAEQKTIELKRLELEQLKANTLATGRDLPPEPAVTPQPAPPKTHVIRPGDTPGVVALVYGLPVSALRAANPGVDFNKLHPGDTIYIPPNGLTPSSGP